MLEFSKPVRLGKNRAHNQLRGLTRIPGRVDPAGFVPTPQVGAVETQPKVLITDDQALFRAGLARLRAADAQVRAINPTDDRLDTGERTLQLTPDFVLMDLQVPTIASVDNSGSSSEPTTFKVVVLAAGFDKEAMRAMQTNGSISELGREVNPDAVVSRIVALYASKDLVAPGRRPAVSKRELSVLSYVAAGQSNKQIANLLGISQKTVRNHLSRIFHKLRAGNRTEAVMKAMRLGLLSV